MYTLDNSCSLKGAILSYSSGNQTKVQSETKAQDNWFDEFLFNLCVANLSCCVVTTSLDDGLI